MLEKEKRSLVDEKRKCKTAEKKKGRLRKYKTTARERSDQGTKRKKTRKRRTPPKEKGAIES